MSEANQRQVAGEHYLKYGNLQPWDLWTMWNLNPFQAVIIKHVVRYRDKLGITDLEKAKHYLEKLIEEEKVKLLVRKEQESIGYESAGVKAYPVKDRK